MITSGRVGVLVVASALAAGALLAGLVTVLQPSDDPAISDPTEPVITRTNVVFVSSGVERAEVGAAGELAIALRERGATVTEVSTTAELAPLANAMDDAWLVIFDTEWLGPRAGHATLHAFFQQVAPQGAGLVAVGDKTSVFFETLRGAGVYDFAEGRNPGYLNPPVVGLTLRPAERPDGTVYRFPVVLSVWNLDSDAADYLLRWS